jgi:16S rRNA (cytosine967-C5)-methyltransferase
LIIKENFKKNPRYLAVYILTLIETKNLMLDTLVSDHDNIINQMNPKDKSLFFNILYGVLRKRGNLDKIIQRNSDKNFSKIDIPVLNALRTGIYQMVYLEKIPVSAAVNTSVEIVKSGGFKSASAFVNGILRNFSRDFDSKKYFKYEKNSADFPKWMTKRWEKRFGKKITEDLCTFYNEVPPITLRVNTVKTTKKDLCELLAPAAENIWQDISGKDSISLIKPKFPVNRLPGFKKGFFQVQDSGAQFVTALLNPKPDENIMDACAGFGGKTGYIAQLTKGKAKITAADSNKSKLEALKEEMLRLGFSSSVKTASIDLTKSSQKIQSGYFDKILIDAPCSGLGVLRRNPDTKWKRTVKDIHECAKTQKTILQNTSALLKKGGLLLYCVCSFEPEETTDVINQFLSQNKNFKRAELDSKDIKHVDENNDVVIFPHISNTDGFFASLLIKDKKS